MRIHPLAEVIAAERSPRSFMDTAVLIIRLLQMFQRFVFRFAVNTIQLLINSQTFFRIKLGNKFLGMGYLLLETTVKLAG